MNEKHSDLDFIFRFQIQISDSDFGFRFRLQISDSDFGFRFQIQISDLDFRIRFQIQIWVHYYNDNQFLLKLRSKNKKLSKQLSFLESEI